MKDPLASGVKEFLKKHSSCGLPFLLGFSGGGDSLALLHLLIECGYGKQLHLAHVDHGWRKESRDEAEILAKMAQELGLPFHLHRIEKRAESNLEAEGREERLRFFSAIYREIGCGALLLAHHADDQAETVLKRVLEGAHLLSLSGIKESSQFEEMKILRPLLLFPKKLILRWLEEKNLKSFEDPTNQDPAFLRARLRTKLLPFLAESFGKEVSSNLIRLGKRFEEVEEMIQGEVEKTLASAIRGPLGLMLEIPKTYARLVRNTIVKR
ncbi:MAG: tRNA lysidine(34) synthetase TilS, partial [Chlamydiales bacterium]